MLIERRGDAVVVWAPAKVNLFLEVLAKRADGYHEIATLMVAVSLYDTLEFKEEASGVLSLDCDHPNLSTGPDNLILRAARLLQAKTGYSRGTRIRLEKRIPMAAGLAGGSTDAAATLAGLNRLWLLQLTNVEMSALSGQLGSDVPFFLSTPVAWCTGRGEKVEALSVAQPLFLVLVSPDVGLATVDVYRNVTVPERAEAGDAIRQALAEGDIEEVGRRLFNRLQPAAERLCPVVAEWYGLLQRMRPAGALMSGSGSSLFALCRDADEAQRMARAVRFATTGKNTRVFIVRSCA